MDDLAERLARLSASAVHDVLRSLGHDHCVLPPDIRPIDPRARLAGKVVTVSGREHDGLDADRTLLAWATLLSEIPPDCIVVCQPNTRAIALMGELSARALVIKGVRGYVVDGGCRDVDLVEESGLTVFCSHFTPSDIAARWLPDPVGGPIAIGSCAIATGDYLVADRDGVVILPAALAAAAVAQAETVMSTESTMRQAILAGMDPRAAYLKFRKF
jgi:4-hydroxy-4-methyl-2-oxoglutarate aldolase